MTDEEGELDPEATIKSYLMLRTEGTRQVRRAVQHYSLDAILAVGFRVRSHRGMHFRQWAVARFGEDLVRRAEHGECRAGPVEGPVRPRRRRASTVAGAAKLMTATAPTMGQTASAVLRCV